MCIFIQDDHRWSPSPCKLSVSFSLLLLTTYLTHSPPALCPSHPLICEYTTPHAQAHLHQPIQPIDEPLILHRPPHPGKLILTHPMIHSQVNPHTGWAHQHASPFVHPHTTTSSHLQVSSSADSACMPILMQAHPHTGPCTHAHLYIHTQANVSMPTCMQVHPHTGSYTHAVEQALWLSAH